MITQAELKERLNYDPETGVFNWRKTWNPVYIGTVAGRVRKAGKSKAYVGIVFSGKEYMAHRLAWLYVYGVFPDRSLDHINRVKHDNRIANLREATPAQNNMNRDISIRNVSGFKGVSYRQSMRKYCASISVLDRDLYLGSFATPEEASAQYERFAKAIHGDFYYKNGASQ